MPSEASASASHLVGKRIRLDGLTSRPELTGSMATVLSYDQAGYYDVELADGSTSKLKASSIQQPADAAALAPVDSLSSKQLLRAVDNAEEAMREGKLSDALEAWLKLSPQLEAKGLDEAHAAVQRSVMMARDRVETARLDGNKHFGKKAWASARKAYGEALRWMPQETTILGNRSLAALRDGDAAAALSDANDAIAADASWFKGHFRRGQALSALGQLEKAASAYAEASRLGEASETAKELKKAAAEARAAADAHIREQVRKRSAGRRGTRAQAAAAAAAAAAQPVARAAETARPPPAGLAATAAQPAATAARQAAPQQSETAAIDLTANEPAAAAPVAPPAPGAPPAPPAALSSGVGASSASVSASEADAAVEDVDDPSAGDTAAPGDPTDFLADEVIDGVRVHWTMVRPGETKADAARRVKARDNPFGPEANPPP
jgi:hypothetical protein